MQNLYIGRRNITNSQKLKRFCSKYLERKKTKPRILWANLFLGTAFIYEEKYLEAIYYLSLTKYYADFDGHNQIGEYASLILSRLENVIS